MTDFVATIPDQADVNALQNVDDIDSSQPKDDTKIEQRINGNDDVTDTNKLEMVEGDQSHDSPTTTKGSLVQEIPVEPLSNISLESEVLEPTNYDKEVDPVHGKVVSENVSEKVPSAEDSSKKETPSPDNEHLSESVLDTNALKESVPEKNGSRPRLATASSNVSEDTAGSPSPSEVRFLREWNHGDDESVATGVSHMTGHTEATNNTSKTASERFEAGDHVIRWKFLKAVMYPIQIHGIVLSVEDYEIEEKEEDMELQQDETTKLNDGPKFKVVIADFGFTKSQNFDAKEKIGQGLGFNKSVNKMMNSYYNGNLKKESPTTPKTTVDGDKTDKSEENSNLSDEKAAEKVLENTSEDDDVLKENEDGKRFRVITVTDPNDLKKWSKINYGASIFSSTGKFSKIKKWFSSRTNIGKDEKTNQNKSLNKDKTEHSELASPIEPSVENDKKNVDDVKEPEKVNISEDEKPQAPSSNEEESEAEPKTLAELITEANKIEMKSRSRRPFSPRRKKQDDMDIATSSSFTERPRSRGGLRNFFSKGWWQKPNRDEEYETLQCSSKDLDDDGSVRSNGAAAQSGPKLPKSDPRKIVLARVEYILAQQDLPESESTLPPYHIFYSNSECLAVWCKTGKFSTLQAAVFLHSTAIGNAKSSIALTAAVTATNPLLIPLVGMFGLFAVGMPYYLLKKCSKKWKASESNLTDGFWASAGPEVFVEAIENWTNLNNDEVDTMSNED